MIQAADFRYLHINVYGKTKKNMLVKGYGKDRVNLQKLIEQLPCATASASSSEVLWRLNSGLTSPAKELSSCEICPIHPSGIVDDIHIGVSEVNSPPKSA